MSNKKASIVDFDDIRAVFRFISRSWYILLISLALFALASYVYTYKMPNIYEAQTQILLKSNDQVNEKNIISEDFGSYYNWWNKSNVDITTEMRVISSYDLLEKALNRMDLQVSYSIVGRIKQSEVYSGMPFKIKVLAINPMLYERDMAFKVIDKEKYKIIIEKEEKEIVKEGFFNKELVDTDFKLLVTNESITIDNLASVSDRNYQFKVYSIPSLVTRFQSKLDVENPEMTNILQLKLDDVISERAQAFLDTLAKVYIENSVKTRLEVNANTLRYIEKQMQEVTGVLAGIEDTMQGYKERKAILDLGKEQDDYFQKMSDYDAQRSKLNLQLGALNSLESYIIEGKDPQFLPPSVYVVSDDVFLKQSVSELYALQIKVNERLN
ncbi:MAG: hypothetical protein JNL69_13485, partial [Bacteroidia bacterium]|nr:hypothetical protein [Bacteroidia bacterium]